MIFLIGADTEGNTVAVEACNKAGIPVYMVATEATGGDWKFIGWVEEDYGRYQGRWVAKNAKKDANIFYLYGTPGREAFIKREAGFLEVIKAERPDLKVVSTQACPRTLAEEGLQVTEDWIQGYGDQIDLIVSQANLIAVGAVQALKAANMLDKVTVVSGIHSGSWDVQQVKDGEVDYAVYVGFDKLGELSADVCARTYLGENILDKELIELGDVTKDNVYEIWPDNN
jgi:inositol transport system substrate-binding protein